MAIASRKPPAERPGVPIENRNFLAPDAPLYNPSNNLALVGCVRFEAISVSARGFGNASHITFMRKNLTRGEKKFRPVDNRSYVNLQVPNSDETITYLDQKVVDGQVYEYKIKMMFEEIMERGNALVVEDQDDDTDYDDTLPYRNLLKDPYTRLKLPTYRENRGGNPLSYSQAKRQMKMLYDKIIARFMERGNQYQVYRTYQYKYMKEAKSYVEKHFGDNYGNKIHHPIIHQKSIGRHIQYFV